MGTTPIKGMRYPDLSQLGMGPDDFNKMAYDLDASYTAEDATRKTALYRNRAGIANDGGLAGSAVKGTWMGAQFNTVAYDTAGMANLGVNNDRLTCKAQGLYLVTFAIEIQISAALGTSGAVWVAISKNGTTTIPSADFNIKQSTVQSGSASLMASSWTAFQLNVNDFVQGKIQWTGTPAGPFPTDLALLTMFQINST